MPVKITFADSTPTTKTFGELKPGDKFTIGRSRSVNTKLVLGDYVNHRWEVCSISDSDKVTPVIEQGSKAEGKSYGELPSDNFFRRGNVLFYDTGDYERVLKFVDGGKAVEVNIHEEYSDDCDFIPVDDIEIRVV
jgi:hypothetical protein